MNILVSCNDNYGMPLMVMLTSFLSMNPCSDKEKHTIYMLETSLSDDMNEKIETCIQGFSACYVRVHLAGNPFASAKTKPYISKETYYRLLAAEYIPKELERILWLDADIIVRKDIRRFYESSFDGNLGIACGYGPAMQKLMYDNACSLKLQCPEMYFNAGVILLNLTEWRNKIMKEKILQVVDSSIAKTYQFDDQDMINLLLDGNIRIEDYRKYNCMIHSITSAADLEYAKEHAAIVHFPGGAKPWKFNDIHFADEWLNWYKECFGEAAKVRRVSYFRMKTLYDRL